MKELPRLRTARRVIKIGRPSRPHQRLPHRVAISTRAKRNRSGAPRARRPNAIGRPPRRHHCPCATHRRDAPASAPNDASLPLPHGDSTTPHPTSIARRREHKTSRPHHPTTSIKPPSPSRQPRLPQTPSTSKTARIAAATRAARQMRAATTSNHRPGAKNCTGSHSLRTPPPRPHAPAQRVNEAAKLDDHGIQGCTWHSSRVARTFTCARR